MRYLLCDKGYDADSLRRSFREAGAIPVIPGRCNRKRTIRYDKQRHRGRHLVETPERLPPRRYPLRQARRQLPLSRSPRNGCSLLAVNESEP